jgi:hypothetical protein
VDRVLYTEVMRYISFAAAMVLSAPQVVLAEDTIGTANPLLVQQIAPDGHWAVICQAREDTDGDGAINVHLGFHGDLSGDRMVPYLVQGTGAGTKIDFFIAADLAGRFIAFARGGHLVLLDTQRHREFDLTKSGRASTTRVDRPASIDSLGRRLAYWRDVAPPVVVVRDLGNGRERVIPVADGEPWAAALSPDGTVLRVSTLRRDASGVSKPPTRATDLAMGACVGPAAAYMRYPTHGDRPDTRFVSLEPGPSRLDIEMEATFTPPAAKPRPFNNRGISVDDASCDVYGAWTGPSSRLPARCIAVEGDRVLALRPDRRFAIYDYDSETRTQKSLELPAEITHAIGRYFVPLVKQRGAVVASEGYVFDLKRGIVVGTYEGRLNLLTDDGRLLTSSTPGMMGPLRWQRPVPLPVPSPEALADESRRAPYGGLALPEDATPVIPDAATGSVDASVRDASTSIPHATPRQ